MPTSWLAQRTTARLVQRPGVCVRGAGRATWTTTLGRHGVPRDLPDAQRRWDAALQSGEPYEVEFRLRASTANTAGIWRGPSRCRERRPDRLLDRHHTASTSRRWPRPRTRGARPLWTCRRTCCWCAISTDGSPRSTRPAGACSAGRRRDGRPLCFPTSCTGRPARLDGRGRQVAHGQTTLAFENRYRTRDGSYRCSTDRRALRRPHPRVARHHRRARRRARQERIWTLSPVLKIVASRDDRLATANPAWTQTLGWSKAQTRFARCSSSSRPRPSTRRAMRWRVSRPASASSSSSSRSGRRRRMRRSLDDVGEAAWCTLRRDVTTARRRGRAAPEPEDEAVAS